MALHHRRFKRKRVPASQEEWLADSSSSEIGDSPSPDLMMMMMLQHQRRPLPSTAVLAALAQSKKKSKEEEEEEDDRMKTIPLLRNLFPQEGTTTTNNDNSLAEGSLHTLDSIDDPALSTLTRGQHTRYRQLRQQQERNVSSSTKLTPMQRKEYYKLRKAVRSEQSRYREARQEFFAKHVDQFRMGFRGGNVSEYAGFHSNRVRVFRHNFQETNLPTKFGKLRQSVSLQRALSHQQPKDDKSSSNNSSTFLPRELFSVQEVTPKVAASKRESQSKTVPETMRSPCPLPPLRNITVEPFLWKDETALRLAKENGVRLITTDSTLETVLSQDSWCIPLWYRQQQNGDDVQVLDVPFPQPSLPRDALTRGIQHALLQSVQRDAEPSFSYWILTIRHSHQQHQRLLVRSQTRSAMVRVHLEYFVERGVLEKISSHERAAWILDDLFQKRNGRLGRADLKVVHKWEPIGLAHALAYDDHDDDNNHVGDAATSVQHNFARMVKLLQATRALPLDGHHLLRCQQLTVGVHKEDTSSTEIDLDALLTKADGVLLGSNYLLQCAQVWEWDDDRILDTFPLPSVAKQDKN